MRRSIQAACVVACLGIGVTAQTLASPAQFREGLLPVTPIQAVTGGEVFVQALVTNAGQLADVTVLRSSPTFTPYVLDALRSWQFQPARERVPRTSDASDPNLTEPVESNVLIACVFRPPTLNTPTVGDPPKDLRDAADDVAFPWNTVTPLYPPLAHADATVLVQVTVAFDGRVVEATIVQSAPGFDEAALSAARQWTFRPARIHGRLEETFAYLVFAFRQPVSSPLPR